MQERNTAVNAIKQVVPDANISTKCTREFQVDIIYNGKVIFTRIQRQLYKKYPKLRKQSIKDIKLAVSKAIKNANL